MTCSACSGPRVSTLQLELDLADLEAAAVPGVQHLDHVRVRLRDDLGDARELARAVGQHDAEVQVAVARRRGRG